MNARNNISIILLPLHAFLLVPTWAGHSAQQLLCQWVSRERQQRTKSLSKTSVTPLERLEGVKSSAPPNNENHPPWASSEKKRASHFFPSSVPRLREAAATAGCPILFFQARSIHHRLKGIQCPLLNTHVGRRRGSFWCQN